jgi:hypothetical protein
MWVTLDMQAPDYGRKERGAQSGASLGGWPFCRQRGLTLRLTLRCDGSVMTRASRRPIKFGTSRACTDGQVSPQGPTSCGWLGQR